MSHYLKRLLLILFIIQLIACNNNKEHPSTQLSTNNEVAVNNLVHLKFLFNNDSIDDIIFDSLPYWKQGVTVGNVMDSINGKIILNFKEHTGMGRLLLGIENITVTDNTFWYLCVNDTASDKGMDNKELSVGSNISWHFGSENPCFKNQLKL